MLTAVIDTGIDYANVRLQKSGWNDEKTALWDQTIPGSPPQGYAIGTEYTQEQINEALAQDSRAAQERIVPSRDTSGHGTAVAGIAAGNGAGSRTEHAGVAPASDLLVVKLGIPRDEGFPRTTELMLGVDYAVRKALEYQMPVAVNISFGNTYGSHDGTSLLERFLDDISNFWKCAICVGSGNEGTTAPATPPGS